MTLQDYIQTLPKDRVQLAANDLEEAAKIEREHAVLPNAVFDTAEQIDGRKLDQPQVPQNSFDIGSEDETKKFISGMEVSHPELVNQLRRDETAWGKMLQVDAANTARLQRDGGIKFTGDEKSDYDFFRWAYGRGMMESDTSAGGLASAFGRGLWQMVKGAGKLGYTAGKAVLTQDPAAAGELAATTVDAAQSAVAEYQQLGAGIAALTSGDNPQVKMAAMYELAKFSDQEQKNHNAWRKAVSNSFAEVPVDEDSVEFMSEAFDISNLIGAGAGKFVTRGAKGIGMGGVADVLGKGRKVWGSDKAAELFAKVPVIGRAHQRAIYMGQADLLSIEAQVAYEEVAQEQARLAALRSTLTNNPSWSSKDVLLKQIASAETAVAEKTAVFDAAKGQLDDVRGKITNSLNLEGRGLLNRAAAGTLDLTGRATAGTGRAISRAYRGASEFLTGEADNAAFDMAAGKVVPGVMSKGNLLTRVGTDMQVAARTMGQNGSSIPYFRRLARAEDASKMTRAASAFMDSSHLAWAADKAADLAQAGAAGAPISGAFGYLSSGGDLAAAAESAGAGSAYGIGGGAYGQWQAYKDPSFRYEELLANRRMFRDMLSRREVNGASQLQVFDRLDAGDQIALATYAQAKPDVSFRLIHEPSQASGYYDRDNNVVVINTASSTAIPDIFRHEVAHFVERHGLEAQVRELYLGDAEKGVVGQYTEMDKLGNPVFVESMGPDGEKQYSYKLNAEGERLRDEYQNKIRAVDPTFTMSDQYLASELFAEQYADRLLSGSFRRDLGRNAVDNVVDALASKPLLKEFMGQIGLLFDQDDKVVGTGVFKELKANPQVDKLISRWNSDIAKGAKPAMTEEADDHVFTERELRDPVVATKWLQSGGAMRFGPDGKPVYDANGVPQFLTEKEAEAQQRDLANELITQIERYNADNPNDPDLIHRREIMDVKGVTRTVFSGRRIPAQVIDALEAQNRFNPHQIAFLRAMSASVEKHGVGAMIAHFYQAAMRKLGGRAYKTLAGRWRRDGVVGFQITKDGNVVINSVSWEQLNENAKKAAKTKQAREVYATAGVPIESAITADVKTYLGNLIDGKPGATDIGEARRDFINNLLGIRMAANADVNPLFETTSAPKTILTNLRLDRMNRVAPLDYVEYAWGPQQYRQAKKNARPDAVDSTSVVREGDADREQSAKSYVEAVQVPEKDREAATRAISDLLRVSETEGSPAGRDAGGPEVGAEIAAPSAKEQALRQMEKRRLNQGDALRNTSNPDALTAGYGEGNTISSIVPELIRDHTKGWDIRGAVINSARDFASLVQMVRTPYAEMMKIAFLDDANRVIHSEILSVGSTTAAMADPLMIARAMNSLPKSMQGKNVRAVVSHNHPSGNPDPSAADDRVQATLSHVAKNAGFELVDHVITNGERYYSYAESGILGLAAGYSEPKSAGRRRVPTGKDVKDARPLPAKADWEIVRRSELKSIGSSYQVVPILGALRQVDPTAAHVVYLNRKNSILAMERMPDFAKMTTVMWKRRILEGAGREGATGFLMTVPDSLTAEAATVVMIAADRFGRDSGVMLMDFHTASMGETTAAGRGLVGEGRTEYQFRPETDDLGFYSQLDRTLTAIPPKASRQQIEAALRDGVKEKGQLKERPVKKEEMDDVKDVTGLSFADWMKQNPDATREQMLDFARENRVRMKDVSFEEGYRVWDHGQLVDHVFGSRDAAMAWVESMIGPFTADHVLDDRGLTDPFGERLYSIAHNKETGEYNIEYPDGTLVATFDTLRHAKNYLSDTLDGIIEDERNRYTVDDREQVRFIDYKLEGGVKYRETILTLPKKKKTGSSGTITFPDAESVDGFLGDIAASGLEDADYARVEDSLVVEFNDLTKNLLDGFVDNARSYNGVVTVGSPATEESYTSRHFNKVPGYLAHVRTTERWTKDNQDIFFAEEIQSDLHQEGRERGYRRKLTEQEMTRVGELTEEEKRASSEMDRIAGENLFDASKETPDEYIDRLERIPEYAAVLENRDRATRERAALEEQQSGVIDAPFKKTWHEMAFKYLLKQAVNADADYLGWTTGAQQNERYNLSKQVDAVSYEKNEDGIYSISGIGKGARAEWQYLGSFKAGDLPGVVGKELAQKMVNGEGEPVRFSGKKMFSGVDLEVGGEGMKGFYDRIIPQFAEKYLKKYGVKPEDIETSDGHTIHAVKITPELRNDVTAYGQAQYRPETDAPAAKASVSKPVAVSTVGLFKGAENPKDITKSSLQIDIARELAARSRRLKRIPYDSRTAAAKDAISETLADEIAYALSQHDNARGWYEAKVAAAMRTFAKIHPEIAADSQRDTLFKALMAITSNQQDVVDNAFRAEELYRTWKETGRIETDSKWGGKTAPSINKTLATLQGLIDANGLAWTHEFLNKKVTVKELRDAGFEVTGDSPDTVVHGAAIFGPKIGAGFFANLQGDFSPVTMDRWLMRTWNRINGSYGIPNPELMGKALADLRQVASENLGLPESAQILGMTDRQLGSWAEARYDNWERVRKFKDSTPFDRPSKRYTLNKQGAEDSPRGPLERKWIREVFSEVDKKLADRGLPAVNNADKQALLWYYEKDLYSLFGYKDRKASSQDYEAAALQVLAARSSR